MQHGVVLKHAILAQSIVLIVHTAYVAAPCVVTAFSCPADWLHYATLAFCALLPSNIYAIRLIVQFIHFTQFVRFTNLYRTMPHHPV